MAVDTAVDRDQYWCSGCQQVHRGEDTIFYVDIGRMCLVKRSGRLIELSAAQRLGLVPEQSG